MTPLRQRMIEDLQLRGYSHGTQKLYVSAVRQLCEHCGKSPGKIAVAITATTKFLNWDKAHDLGKYGLAIVHQLLPFDVNLNHRKAYQPG